MRKYTLLIFYFIVSINPNTQMKAHPLAELIGQSVSSNTSDDSKKFLEADKTEAEVSISTGTKVTDRMIEYKEKVLPNIDGFAIQTNGKIITEKNQIPSITISYGSYNIAHTFGLKLIQFTYENNNYVLLNDGNYKYYLIHEENWKTELYKNYPNVNNIKVFRTLKYEEMIERSIDILIPEFFKNKDSYSEIILFTEYDLDNKKVKFLSPILFDSYSFDKSLMPESEYPIKLPKDYYFSISDEEFISFFNSSITKDISKAIIKYDYNIFHLIEQYDRYEDNTWIYPSEKFVIFSSDDVSFQFYIGKLSKETKILRMSLETMGCNKYYDRIKYIVFINENDDRLSIDIPYENTDYKHSRASFDILLKLNGKEYIDLDKLKKILSGNKVEIMISFSESYRHSYFVNRAKANELLFMINSFEQILQ